MSDLDLEVLSGVTDRWVSPEFRRLLLETEVFFVGSTPDKPETAIRCDAQGRMCVYTNPPEDMQSHELLYGGPGRSVLGLTGDAVVLISAFGRRPFERKEVIDLLDFDPSIRDALTPAPNDSAITQPVGDHVWVSRPSVTSVLAETLRRACATLPAVQSASVVAVEDDEGTRIVLGLRVDEDRDAVERAVFLACEDEVRLGDHLLSIVTVPSNQAYPLAMLDRAVIFTRA